MSKSKIRKEDALEYHSQNPAGKIEVIPTKDSKSQRDLALAYSPGVAEPCKEIAKNKEDVYKYTAKGNLVAVISDGTAVLGLGNIGPEASKPVMEGKGILFKIFAGIDVFDLELNTSSVEEFIQVVKAMEPTFGGINLEDIKSPDCFEIESRLKKELNIPVMHDDQHGTAIIAAAGMLNALEIVDKKIEDVTMVVSGAGASALSCVKILKELGMRAENIVVCDSRGVIRKDREQLDSIKSQVATEKDAHQLEDAIVGADVFLGLSAANVLSPEMLQGMAKDPIVFALANPDPEIDYELAIRTREDVIMATGRSDYPNQVNNVLGFPFIFRGALDVRATEINETMKLAAVKALAELAKEPVPEVVNQAYNQAHITFGRQYIIPKPLDPRLLTTVAPAVAKAAMESGVANAPVQDWEEYKIELRKRMGTDDNIIRLLSNKAKQNPKRVVFAEADDFRVLKAAQIAQDEGIAKPILLGPVDKINSIKEKYQLDLTDIPVIDPRSEEASEQRNAYAEMFFEKRKRKGYNLFEAKDVMKSRSYFGAMMVELGEADAMISGLSRKYSSTIRPALQIVGTYQPKKKVSSMYLMLTKKGPLFFADTTIIPEPTSEELVDIAKLVASTVKESFNIEPRIAMLSYSNFGSSDEAEAKKVRKAVELLKQEGNDFVVDGEIQANFAFNTEALKENYPFSDLVEGEPNILIFPNLSSANIAYKLLQVMQSAEAIGPIVLGLKKPIHVLQLGSSVREIVNMVTIATIDAQSREKTN
ncbi:NADP-dependent malic enzyme [Rapidithrix thailandica]|uniref:NADP-dependent malic enzyme n=1 Tax=Rapidithrix thailandica TaxID=413964 RepID=A0AAW9SCI2_9BACT